MDTLLVNATFERNGETMDDITFSKRSCDTCLDTQVLSTTERIDEFVDIVHVDISEDINVNIKDDVSKKTDDVYCGIFSCKPQCMQKCKTMCCFTACYSFTGIVTSALNVYMNSQITTLEKQFNMSSSLSGMLMSCNDIGYLVTTLILSYYTRKTHIPRALALSTVLYGLSGLLCTVAFFGTRSDIPNPSREHFNKTLVHLYNIPLCMNRTELTSPLCFRENNQSTPVLSISHTWRDIAIVTLGIGMALQGVAKSPRHPFLGTYIDDNVPKTKTTMYLGTMVGLSITGPAIAFMLGGVFSKMYITLEETSISPRDPRWLGAWWLGFLVFGLMGLIVGIPLTFFPKRYNTKPVSEDKTPVTSRKYKLLSDIKGLLRVLLRLVLNPVYMCIILSNSVNLICVSGFVAFMPKYLETQFNIPTWQANMYLGTMNMAAAFVGTILGGCLTTRYKLSPMCCLKAVIISKCLGTLLGATGFFTGCNQPVFQSPAFNDSNSCACNHEQYFPVCGAGKWNYFSPCHAGCHAVGRNGMYTQCFNMPFNSTQTVLGNLCHSECQNLYIFLAMMFITAFITTLVMMPTFIVSIRSVPEQDKPPAIGLSSFSGTLLGWFSGPIIFGSLIDTTCLVWKESCQSSGACLLYNIDLFRIRFHVLVVALRIISIILSCTALIVVCYFKKYSFQDHQDLELKAATSKSVNVKAATSKSVNVTAATSKSVNVTAATSKSVNVKAATSKSVNVKAATSKSVNVTAATSKSVNVKAATSKSVNVTAVTNRKSM